MKLLHARFHNFRLLRDLALDFSVDPEKPLTVIRAENESGKTTILTALQWGLFGDDALPNRGENYRIHPIDWAAAESSQVPISVEIEYEVATSVRTPDGTPRQKRNRYRLVRATTEHVSGTDWKRGRNVVQLFHCAAGGDTPLNNPEAQIVDDLPPELREVFFTDGDRALSFIEAGLSATTKRDRVQRAIEALLGLSVIEAAQKHVRDAAMEVNRQARGITTSIDLRKVTEEIENSEQSSDKLKQDLVDAKQKFENCDESLNELEKRLAAALAKGDQEALSKELIGCRTTIKSLDAQLEALDRAHSNLFRSSSLARDLLGTLLENGMAMMDGLKQQGKIPNTTIAVLEDRLQLGECICGETLDPNDRGGQKRRSHIMGLIEKSKKEDEVQKTLTEFYYRSKSLLYDDSREGRPWIQMYAEYFQQRSTVEQQREREGTRMRSIETRIEQLGKSDIGELRETQKLYRGQRDDAQRRVAVLETQLKEVQRSLEGRFKDRDRLLKEESKGKLISGQLQAGQDLVSVLDHSYERIRREELLKASRLMNDLFLKMIGADPEQNAIIKRAEINELFDIVVYGAEERRLNPDQDLNGASRRALTLSFILALTKVSEVDAPNVIDTPLGMMAGYVKREVLRTAIKESSQLILFLTSEEIANCEDILDSYAGVVTTLTNPAHYPKMLVNRPPAGPIQILRCSCGHRERCTLCDRRLDEVPEDAVKESYV
jgi:DNA sulfur modification protein DndD